MRDLPQYTVPTVDRLHVEVVPGAKSDSSILCGICGAVDREVAGKIKPNAQPTADSPG